MFDIPEIIEVLKSSGATDEVVEKVSTYFHNRLGEILDDMAKEFMTSEEYTQFLLEEQQINIAQLRVNKEEKTNEIRTEQSI